MTLQLSRGHPCRSGCEIAAAVEIGNQSGLPRLPAEHFACSPTRGGIVEGREMCEPAKVYRRLIRSLSDNWHVEVRANRACNIPERDALLGDPVIPRSCDA